MDKILSKVCYKAPKKGTKIVISTIEIDRDFEIMVPLGCRTENFEKNPVMLFVHDRRSYPVAKLDGIQKSEIDVSGDIEFADTEEGVKLAKLYKLGFMSAFSVGFSPIKIIEGPFDETSAVSYTIDGQSYELDISEVATKLRRIYVEWELMEASCVPVPANANALMAKSVTQEMMDSPLDFFDEIVKLLDKVKNPPDPGTQEGETTNPPDPGTQEGGTKDPPDPGTQEGETTNPPDPGTQEGGTKDPPDPGTQEGETTNPPDPGTQEGETKGPVPVHNPPKKNETALWDASKARSQLARWASSDDSGDKEKISWSKYAKGFAWFDSGASDTLGAYKLPHHFIEGGELVTVKRGVFFAMAALNGARGNRAQVTDRPAVYKHLVAHYKQFGMDAPSLKEYGEYTEDELKEMEVWGYVKKPTEIISEKTANEILGCLKASEASMQSIKEALLHVKVVLQVLEEKFEEENQEELRDIPPEELKEVINLLTINPE